ncbi:hypothetical protein Pan241w_11460 [Gimesia alba]|uniref:Uncharacterized protein n=1 Tax=Gimesia alba TaxID=2527973 RepID=A0A517RB19_9PLAN|nr:hypothetical protein [Gimesia alba]QDT41087.1 hypothetical protein Pan241w_11460 [Gimesia alba]
MTTTVTVEAHCDASTTEVQIAVSNGGSGETHIVQDGHSHQLCIHDDREVTVREVPKASSADYQLSSNGG